MTIKISELFKGVSIVIDDEVDDTKANITQILKQISSLEIPIVKYAKLPSEGEVSHFQNLSFVLFDWRLIKPDLSTADVAAGVSIPPGLENAYIEQNIRFIRNLNAVCYCPIFVFTNEDKDFIIAKLNSEHVFESDKPCNVLIRSKSTLQEEGSLQKAIEEWIKTNPSIYVLKEWEREYQRSKNRLFFEFQNLSPVWPQIMWKCFEEDGGNKSLELGELISRNLDTRMKPFEFDETFLKGTDAKPDRNELRQVLEGAKFLKQLHEKDISTGDVYLEEYQDAEGAKRRYWLNIRAQCDLVRNENPHLYCLPGYELTQKANGKIDNISFSQGEFVEKGYHAIVPFIDNGKIIEFKFSEFEIRQKSSLPGASIKRIGRILPPYITKIQQRFALYLHRQGLPRIPDEAIF
ncbi:MAG: hypothetical protein PHC61_02120 [Chitinivibrionales bacterium]|nr:hypothetical protein [Chitinivibrionales bacterium]